MAVVLGGSYSMVWAVDWWKLWQLWGMWVIVNASDSGKNIINGESQKQTLHPVQVQLLLSFLATAQFSIRGWVVILAFHLWLLVVYGQVGGVLGHEKLIVHVAVVVQLLVASGTIILMLAVALFAYSALPLPWRLLLVLLLALCLWGICWVLSVVVLAFPRHC